MPRGTLKVVMDFEVTGNAELKLKKVRMEAKKTGEAVDKMGKKAGKAAKGGFKDLAGAYNALVVAGRVARAIAAGIQPAIKMEEAMKKLEITTGITGNKLKTLEKAARDAAARTPFDPAEALNAMTDVQLATGDVQSSVKLLVPTLQLANTYLGKDTKKATRVAADFIRGFGLNADQATASLDQLRTAALFTRTRIDDMTGGFRKFGIVGKMAGTSFTDVLRVFTLAQATFRNAESNMTGLQRVVQRFSRPEMIDMFDKFLNVKLFNEATGALRPLTDIVVDMSKAAKMNEHQWTKFVDIMSTGAESRAVKPLIAAVNTLNKGLKDQHGVLVKDAKLIAEFDRRLINSGGSLNAMAQEGMKPLGQQLTLLHDAFFKLLESVFSPLLHVLTPIVQAFQAFANAISYVMNDMGYFSDIISGVVGVLMMLVVSATMGRMAHWALAAVQQMTAMASTWAAKSQKELNISQVQGAATAGVAAKSNGFLARSLIGLRFVAHTVKMAFKAMWRAITGPIGWIMLALEGVLWIIGKITGSGQKSAEQQAKAQQRQLMKQMATSGVAFQRQGRTISKLDKSIQNFKEAIKGWSKTIEKQLPVLPKTGVRFVLKNIEGVIKQYKVQGEAAATLRHQMDTLRQVMGKGPAATLDEIEKAQGALMVLGGVLQGTMGPSKALQKQLKAVGGGLEGFKDKSGHIATLLLGLGIGSEEYKKHLQAEQDAVKGRFFEQKARLAAQEKVYFEFKKRTLSTLGDPKFDKAAEKLRNAIALTKQMMEEQNKFWEAGQKRISMIGRMEFDVLGEYFREAAKKAPSKKQQELAKRFAGAMGPGLPGAYGAPAAPPPGGPTAAAAAANAPDHNISRTATNTSETVKQLKKLNTNVGKLKPAPPAGPGATPPAPPPER